MRRSTACIASLATAAFCARARAIILLNTGDPNSHVIHVAATDPPSQLPTGTLSNSGSQYMGEFGGSTGFTGIPIGPHTFLTAHHIGVSTATGAFTYAGSNYQITGVSEIGSRDIDAVTVSGTLPYWAPVYNEATDGLMSTADGGATNKELVAIGRGTPRGDAINVTTSRGTEGTLRGWSWPRDPSNPALFYHDGYLRWGTNTINGFIPTQNSSKEFFYYNFDFSGGTPDESTISDHDSGGGVFVQGLHGVWKLAGSVSGVLSFFENPSGSNSPDAGAIFDYRDLNYTPDGGATYQSWNTNFGTGSPGPGFAEISNISDVTSLLTSYIPHTGDVNCDGKVNALDFNAIATNFGTSSGATWLTGDMNYDGNVNATDFMMLAQNFGFSGAAPGDALGAGALTAGVPEPASLIALPLAGLALRRRSRR